MSTNPNTWPSTTKILPTESELLNFFTKLLTDRALLASWEFLTVEIKSFLNGWYPLTSLELPVGLVISLPTDFLKCLAS